MKKKREKNRKGNQKNKIDNPENQCYNKIECTLRNRFSTTAITSNNNDN